jgi:K+/H+ antiporter YhaU regulatory subunit KhtT
MESDSGLDFVVDDLPEIGRRYQMTGSNGGRITVVVHHSGRRVVYGRYRRSLWMSPWHENAAYLPP